MVRAFTPAMFFADPDLDRMARAGITRAMRPQAPGLREERVMLLLLADRGHRPVTRAEDGVIGQTENILAVGAKCFFVGNHAAAH